MKRFWTMAVCAAALAAARTAAAYGEFGPIESARAAHPECFATGVVWRVVHEGVSWTVFCGDAERLAEAEDDFELYDEAETQAKLNFYEAVKKRENDPRARVSIKGGRRMYRFKEGKRYFVVYGAKTEGIEVVRPLAP